MKRFSRYLFLLLWLTAWPSYGADLLKVVDPWARATVPGQNVGGVYMELVASENLRLTGIKTAASESAEVHQMKMEKGMMRMRPVPFLQLPAGKRVKLEPGGYHVMLFDLQKPVKEGDVVPLTLTFEDKAGRKSTVEVKATAKALAPAAPASKQ
jgi:periplasmic copper chaperone A